MEFIRQLTCTDREGRRRLFDAQETEASDAKKIRHFYILCVLLFNANHACSAPLHVLLTETILCHGGDQVLVQIMNRIGAVASLDTSNRLATHVVQTRLVKGIKPSLIPNALTIVSVDDIDILQPHAVVLARYINSSHAANARDMFTWATRNGDYQSPARTSFPYTSSSF